MTDYKDIPLKSGLVVSGAEIIAVPAKQYWEERKQYNELVKKYIELSENYYAIVVKILDKAEKI